MRVFSYLTGLTPASAGRRSFLSVSAIRGCLLIGCCLLIGGCLLVGGASVQAEVKTRTIEYSQGGVELQGHLAWDDSFQGKRPGVLVVHEWWGLDEYAQDRAEQLAELGYVAFALDMYGKGKLAEHPKQASQWSSEIRENIDQWLARANAGLNVLREQERVNADQLAAIGYCFGGATVVQMAYHGADLKGVVSFHGSLPVLEDGDARINAAILACHGAEDPFVKQAQVQKFIEGLGKSDADWHLTMYAHARHSFTNPAADSHGLEGLKYNRKADFRSWAHMRLFFDELFEQ